MAAPQPQSQSSFASISFSWTDRLRFVQFPPAIIAPLTDRIRASWPPGIQAQQAHAQHAHAHAHEYKLRGAPFGGSAGGEGGAVGGCRLVRDVLAFLHARGWVLVAPVGHGRAASSKDSLVFRQRRRAAAAVVEGGERGGVVGEGMVVVVVPPPLEWLVVAPGGTDRLRVISDGPTTPREAAAAPSSTKERDHDELGVLVQALRRAFAAVDYFQSGEWSVDSYEFKLKGYPWSAATGEKSVKAERLLLAVVETLDRFGWRSYATVTQRSGSDAAKKADTWYFVREEGWVPGSPFNGQ